MCGIAGILAFEGSTAKVSPKIAKKMCDQLAHRGPDGEGLWISADGSIALGHRRLSIIDLSTVAGQPMCNQDESIWLSFNGEIYNHREIRSELQKRSSYVWKTDHSDTEVIIHAYEEWGIECLEKFRGMFAFALWDSRRKELLLVRDRLGVKPLYYSIYNNQIAFASEIKALLVDQNLRRDVDEEALYHYLSFLTTPAPNTLFKGIKKIPRSTWIRVKSSGEVIESQYWDVGKKMVDLSGMSEAEISQLLLSNLRDAVRYRKVSDVPVGVFLSGGIDSSTNAVLFSEGESSPINVFSIGYDQDYGSYKNELSYARLVAEQVHAKYHERILKIDDFMDFLPSLARIQDEPIADPVCVPVYYVSQLARERGVVVCQVGEGADEVFCGYPSWTDYITAQSYSDLPIPKVVKRGTLEFLELLLRKPRKQLELLRRSSKGERIFWSGAEAFFECEKKRLLSDRLAKKFKSYSSYEVIDATYKRFLATALEKSALNWMAYADLSLRLPELLLMRVDKMSMAVGLEARVPFLDHKFIELAMSIPQRERIKGGVSKYILKKAVGSLIPQKVLTREKQGFGVPVHEWFFDVLGGKVNAELNLFCKKTDYFNWLEVEGLIQRKSTSQLWYLYNFLLWWKEYIE